MIIPADTDSLILWYAALQCFFFKVASALDVFFTTASLSQNMFASPTIGTPKDRSLYRRDIIRSVAFRKVTISDPNVEVSAVFCFLELQFIKVILQNNNIPVCDLLVNLSPAWSVSTNVSIWIDSPSGSGISRGNSSTASGYMSYINLALPQGLDPFSPFQSLRLSIGNYELSCLSR